MLRVLHQLEEAILAKQTRLVQLWDGLAFFLLIVLRLALAVNTPEESRLELGISRDVLKGEL